ncbi:MAG: hypothetical protein ACK4K9_04725 [Bacteroidia bacterium]
MKKLYFLIAITLFVVACQKDDDNTDINNNNTTENFIGRWYRDTVIEILNNQTELVREENYGIYQLNSDETGLLTIGSTEYAVTWFFMKDQNKINISEKDWVNQTYDITKISSVKYKLSGRKYVGQNSIQRILYLRKIK